MSNPQMFAGDPCRFLTAWLLWASTGNLGVREGADILETVFDNLPEELRDLEEKRQRTIAQSYLIAGLHTLIWGASDDSAPYLKAAFDAGAVLDDVALRMAVYELLNREAEFGPGNPPTFDELIATLSRLQRHDEARRLTSFYRLNRAFHLHSEGRIEDAGADLLRLVASNPSHLLNRGVVSMLRHALTKRVRGVHSGHTS